MRLTYKMFRQKMRQAEDILKIIKRGEIPEEVVLKSAGEDCKTIDDVIKKINKYIADLKILPFAFYRPNGTINKKAFDEYYERFIHADAEGIANYERIYNAPQSEILKFLNDMKENIENEEKKSQEKEKTAQSGQIMKDIKKANAKLQAIEEEMERIRSLKKELVELGIAEDDEGSEITIKPSRFSDYLRYLEKHPNEKI